MTEQELEILHLKTEVGSLRKALSHQNGYIPVLYDALMDAKELFREIVLSCERTMGPKIHRSEQESLVNRGASLFASQLRQKMAGLKCAKFLDISKGTGYLPKMDRARLEARIKALSIEVTRLQAELVYKRIGGGDDTSE